MADSRQGAPAWPQSQQKIRKTSEPSPRDVGPVPTYGASVRTAGMILRIAGTNLPGRSWGGYDNIHVGVQRKAEPVDLVPGDATHATWELDVHRTDDGDLRGPHVQGRRGDRFVYLTWGTVGAAGGFTMFRRAKLMLAAVDPAVLDAACQPGHALHGTLSLTGAHGAPTCASVRPPAISWTAQPAG